MHLGPAWRFVTVRRFAVAVLGGAFLLCAAPHAYACQFPDISIPSSGGSPSGGPPSAGPGDQVVFTISNVDQGARWDVSLPDHPIDGGVGDGSAVRGEFTIPDLGSRSRTVKLHALVDHDDGGPYPSDAELEYRAPAPPAGSAPEPSQEPASPGQPDAAPVQAEQPAGVPRQPDKGPDADLAPRVRPGRTPARIGARTTHEQKTSRTETRLVTRSRTTVVHATPVVTARAPEKVGSGPKAKATAPRRTSHMPPMHPPREPTRTDTPAPPTHTWTIPSARSGSDSPPVVLLLLLLAGAAAAVVYAIRRARPGPGAKELETAPPPVPPEPALHARPRELLVEAELQEIVAEERARQVAREAAHIRSGPG